MYIVLQMIIKISRMVSLSRSFMVWPKISIYALLHIYDQLIELNNSYASWHSYNIINEEYAGISTQLNIHTQKIRWSENLILIDSRVLKLCITRIR